ncbi:MAG: glycosyltransferase family 2 protein [Thermoplasmatales archaeon]
MNVYWWAVFSIDILFASGIMLTYLGRRERGEAWNSTRSVNEVKRALVILPIKGVDYELDKNLSCLKNQDYGSFDIIAVVDSEEDKSVPFLEKEGIEHMVSSTTCSGCSGKVRAIYSAVLKFQNYDFYVVADSDIRANSTWLSDLLLPLWDQGIGASTTFPIFYPEGGFWSKFKMFWGLVGQSMMESNLTRFVWGGSMAFRKDILDQEFLEHFSKSVSDDIAVLRIIKARGLKVSYVPEARPRIYSNDDFKTFIEWSNRQTSFSIYSTKKTFVFGMSYYLISIYLFLSSIVLSYLVNLSFAIFLLPFVFNSINSERKVPVKVWYFPLLTFMLPFIYVWNLGQGILRGKVTWRGTTYSLSKNF